MSATAPGAKDTDAPNPFPGLRPFREDEEHLFFGRESQVDAMVDKLAATRFLAVVGGSGSGKSSLVNCGLRPALSGGLMARAGTAWRMAQFRPGSDPLHAMTAALAADGVLFRDFQAAGLSLAEIVETTLRMSKLGLIDIYEQAHLPGDVNLLVVVDQFEELFRYRQLCVGAHEKAAELAEQATAFVNLLLEAKQQTACPIYVVLTMRSDFLGDCAQFAGLAEAINAGQYLVPRLTRDERRAAIAGPVGVGGAEISPVLLTRLVNDVGDNPDQLSILQHALNRTWARWQHEGGAGPLDLAHYESIGTMAHALDQHAERAYAEINTPWKQDVCEKIFKALTDKATDSRGVRRPTTLGTLCVLADATEAEVTQVIDVFRRSSRSFLMPPAGDALAAGTVIDISHESLMRVWKRLNAWADEEARSAQTYRRLADTAALRAAGKASLWRDPDLANALEWQQREAPNATWAERYAAGFEGASAFLQDSAAAQAAELEAERQKAEAERRGKEREEAQERALAEEAAAHLRERRVRWGLTVVLAIVLCALAFGWHQMQLARGQRTIAEAQRVLAEKQTEVVKELEADETYKAAEAELTAVYSFDQEEDWANRLTHLDLALAWSGKEKNSFGNWTGALAKIHAEAAAALWAELRYGAASRSPLIRCVFQRATTKNEIQRMAWSPREPLLATAGRVEILLWSFSGPEAADVSGQPSARLEHSPGSVSELRFSSDGKMLLVGGEKGWEVISIAERKLTFTSPPGESILAGGAFSPDGTRVVSRLKGGPPRVVSTTDSADPGIELADAPLASGLVAWSPTGERIALADPEKRLIRIHSIARTGAASAPLGIEAFADVAALRAAVNIRTQVDELSFDASGNLLLIKDKQSTKPLYETWVLESGKPVRQNRTQAEFRAWFPRRSLLLDRSLGDDPAAILKITSKSGRALPIDDPSRPQFSATGAGALFVQAKRNYQVLDLETGYPITPPFGWWRGPITARLSLRPEFIASVENKYDLAFWDLRPEQGRWHADPPQPPPPAPCASPNKKWAADLSVGQRVVVAPSDNDWHPVVVICLDEQPSGVGWSEDGRHLRIYSHTRGFMDLEWDPPTEVEPAIRDLVRLLISRESDAKLERFGLRKKLSSWKANDPRWQKLLTWWSAGRPSETPPPNATVLEPPTDEVIASVPVGRDPAPSVWVFHDSNIRQLTDADLRCLSDDELWIARNEIFARRGAKIGGDRGRKLIQNLGAEFHDSGMTTDPYDSMNGVEKANILLIKSTESQRLIEQ